MAAVVINVPATWRINMFTLKGRKEGPAKGQTV